MSNSGFAVGDRVARVDDGIVGVVATLSVGGGLGVRWEPSGVIQMVVPVMIRKV